jgi:hypothetical protein
MQYGKIFGHIAPIMREWESLRARSAIIANDSVQELIYLWDRYLVKIIVMAAEGVRATSKDWQESPYHSLVKAMRDELQLDERRQLPLD